MKAKRIIKQFVPPAFMKLKHQLQRQNSVQRECMVVPEKKIAYDYLLDMRKRSRLHFQNLGELAKDYSFEQIRSMSSDDIEPNFYGSFCTLRQYSGQYDLVFPPRSFSIQHGIIYEIGQWERKKKDMINFMWSKYISDLMREATGAELVVPIGAPFLYAESILAEEQIKKEKKRLGRNLLAFPMHSTHYTDKQYNPEKFITLLKKQRNEFDTVRVCLYWKDVQKGMDAYYRDAGFECVCCGHMFDQSFLQRQKALFDIADATISNAVGSHIGYSISVGKPHWLVPDEFILVDLATKEAEEEMLMINTSPNYREIMELFSNNSDFQITSEQVSAVDKFWGLSDKKTKTEMNKLLCDCYDFS